MRHDIFGLYVFFVLGFGVGGLFVAGVEYYQQYREAHNQQKILDSCHAVR